MTFKSKNQSWLKIIPTLTNNQMNLTDNFYRNWLRALQAVDEMLLNITNTLEMEGILNNVNILFQ